MKLYWPQHKVYLYGLLALFPDRLGNKDLAELKKFTGRKQSGINKQEFLLELTEYLSDYEYGRLTTGEGVKPEWFASQEQKLVLAIREKFDAYNYAPIITLTDVWPSVKDRSPLKTTFWELIFTEHFRAGNIQIVNVGYLSTYIDLSGGEAPLPFAEFEVRIGTHFQRAIEPARLEKAPPIMQRAWIKMPYKHVIVELGNGHKYQINRQKNGLRTDLAPYSLMKCLIKYPAAAITLKYANEKLDGCEDVDKLDEVARQCGFDEELKELFFEISTATKLKLREEVYLSKDEIALLPK
jgi:hypothetical protein